MRKFMVIFVAIFLLSYAALAEGFDYSMLDGLSVADLENLKQEIDTRIEELKQEPTTDLSAESVASIQDMLVGVGLLEKNSSSGVYDSDTKRAIALFQRWVNSELGTDELEVTGVANENTLEYLEYAYRTGMFYLGEKSENNPIEIYGAVFDEYGNATVKPEAVKLTWECDITADSFMLYVYRADDTEQKSPLIRQYARNNTATLDLSALVGGEYRLLIGAHAENSDGIGWIESKFSIIGNPDSVANRDPGVWRKYYFVDEFDTPTDSAYIRPREDIWGTFSNSAVDDRELRVSFLVTDDREIHVFLYEYGDNLVKNIFSDSVYYNTAILDSEKNKHNLQGRYPYHGDRLIFSGTGFDTITKALSLGGKVRFSIKAEDSLDSYQFTIEDATGFDVAYEDMLNSK